jgi:hypothetical protein
MKQILALIAGSALLVVLATGCETTGTGGSTSSSSSAPNPKKESLLAQSGFVLKLARSGKQQQVLSTLPKGKCSAITYQNKVYYVYPTATANQAYVGRQKQFDAYKSALHAQAMAKVGQQEAAGELVMSQEEDAGPANIAVRDYDGFGPMSVLTH